MLAYLLVAGAWLLSQLELLTTACEREPQPLVKADFFDEATGEWDRRHLYDLLIAKMGGADQCRDLTAAKKNRVLCGCLEPGADFRPLSHAEQLASYPDSYIKMLARSGVACAREELRARRNAGRCSC